jgi:membrane protease YdiL (CAAX protease family)
MMFAEFVVPGNLPILTAMAVSVAAWVWAGRWIAARPTDGAPSHSLFEPILRPRRVWSRETVIVAILGVFLLPLLAAVPLVRNTADPVDQARLILLLSMVQLGVATAAIMLAGVWQQTGMAAWSRDIELLPDDTLRSMEGRSDDPAFDLAVERVRQAAEQHRAFPPRIAKDVRWGIWAGLAGLAPGYAINAVIFLVGWKDETATHPLFQAIIDGGADRTWILLHVGFTAIILAPLLEELQYRAVLQGWLAGRFPASRAVLIVALVFAAIHWAPGRPDALPLLPLAFLLGHLYAARGSIAANIIAHTTFNAVNIAVAVAELSITTP